MRSYWVCSPGRFWKSLSSVLGPCLAQCPPVSSACAPRLHQTKPKSCLAWKEEEDPRNLKKKNPRKPKETPKHWTMRLLQSTFSLSFSSLFPLWRNLSNFYSPIGNSPFNFQCSWVRSSPQHQLCPCQCSIINSILGISCMGQEGWFLGPNFLSGACSFWAKVKSSSDDSLKKLVLLLSLSMGEFLQRRKLQPMGWPS